MAEPCTWDIVAVNLPEHARNPIHTDEGARAAGFPSALVAGVTTYAYLTHVPLAAWGIDWLASGGGEVRLWSPVFAGDLVECRPEQHDGRWTAGAWGPGDERPRVTLALDQPGSAADPRPLRAGEVLSPRRIRLVGEWGADYASRAGDDLDTCSAAGVVHPAVWPALANHLVHAQVARGPWIHLRSRITHHATARVGAEADVSATVIERVTKASGERAILDVAIEVDGRRVATVEHESIVALTAAAT